MLADDSLPAKGPGRADNGNLHLTEFRLCASAGGGRRRAEQRVELQNATADFDQQDWTSSDGDRRQPADGWGVHPQRASRTSRCSRRRSRQGFDGGTTLTFVLEQHVGRQHTIGRLRLSVTTAKRPVRAEPAAAGRRGDPRRARGAADATRSGSSWRVTC